MSKKITRENLNINDYRMIKINKHTIIFNYVLISDYINEFKKNKIAIIDYEGSMFPPGWIAKNKKCKAYAKNFNALPFFVGIKVIEYDLNKDEFIINNRSLEYFYKEKIYSLDHLDVKIKRLCKEVKKFVENNKVNMLVTMGGQLEEQVSLFAKNKHKIDINTTFKDLWKILDFRFANICILGLLNRFTLNDLLASFRVDKNSNPFISGKEIAEKTMKYYFVKKTSKKEFLETVNKIIQHNRNDLEVGLLILNWLNSLIKIKSCTAVPVDLFYGESFDLDIWNLKDFIYKNFFEILFIY
ncbi:hypothetical protein SHELI_v1c09250 [Spiroplasma helicoides]|uniref:Uncharacterized protein n=1 Tax=Spiroplasma helicoides TaxID=216938 RepID=A0A1B3SLS4_9MOLU|nr:hypothetical protein [Spiroplasma helicoides]AOG60874.1 hypothetical protein SHELI_v1c09250 [Spiroplasma helicoides]